MMAMMAMMGMILDHARIGDPGTDRDRRPRADERIDFVGGIRGLTELEHRVDGGEHAVAFSLGLCVLLLLNRQTRDNFAVQNATATYFKPSRPERIPLGDWLMMAVTGLEFAYVFVIALAGALDALDWALAGIGAYVAVIFVGALWMTFAKAAELDRATSSSDPR